MPTKHVSIKHVRESADFAAVLAYYGVVLDGEGEKRSALCPFHQERKGSFKVNLGRRLFNCFGCGAGGNVIDFGMRKEEANVRAATIKVAEICNIPIAPDPKKDRKKDPIESSTEEAGNPATKEPTENPPLSFSLDLNPDHPYLAARVSKKTIETFGLGFCRRGMMKGRIAIPIASGFEKIVAYAGRWADNELPEDTAKYLLPKNFHKQLELFGLQHLPDSGSDVVMVESF